MLRTTLAILALAALAPAHGARIFKCEGADGSVTFTTTACPDKTEGQHYADFTPEPEAPAPVQDNSYRGDDTYPAASAYTQERHAQAAYRATPVAQPQGFACSANGKQWIQPTPCPSTSTTITSDRLSGPVTGSGGGGWIHGSIRRKETVDVQQQALSKRELCESLRSNASVAEKGRNRDSAYERNKMRDAAGC